MRTFLTAVALSTMLAGGAAVAGSTATSDTPAPQASIPFVNHGNIRSFHAVDDETVYLQAMNRKWYKADLIGPCTGLPYATGIGVDARPMGILSRFGTIIVDGERCKIGSLTVAEAPPSRS